MNIASSLVKALPHYTGATRLIGATLRTNEDVAPVTGAPSMRVLREHHAKGSTVRTILSLRMQHADLLTDDEIKELEVLWQAVVNEARRLSRGGLSLKELRRRGHPYGYGVRTGLGRLRGSGRGVSNLAIVNKQSGDFAQSWSGHIERNKHGLGFVLANDADVAGWLALGTRRMRAHGPFTTAPARYKARIEARWRTLARKAMARHNALLQMEGAKIGRMMAHA